MSMMKLQADSATEFGVEDFMLSVVLPRLSPNPTMTEGTLTLHVLEQTDGEWTVDFASGEVFAGRASSNDCRVEFSSTAFRALIGGSLDATQALADGSLSCFGDPSLLVALGEVLSKPMSQVQGVSL